MVDLPAADDGDVGAFGLKFRGILVGREPRDARVLKALADGVRRREDRRVELVQRRVRQKIQRVVVPRDREGGGVEIDHGGLTAQRFRRNGIDDAEIHRRISGRGSARQGREQQYEQQQHGQETLHRCFILYFVNYTKYSRTGTYLQALYRFKSAVKSSSDSTGTPIFSAFSSFEPASSPATTYEVFFDTEPETLPPRDVISSVAAARV